MTRTWRFFLLVACICTLGAAGAVFAGVNPVTLPSATCPDNLNSCTANDVTTTVKAVTILNVCYHLGVSTGSPCITNANCAAGDTCAQDVCESLTDNILVQISTAYASTANQRYDLGLFVSGDGGTVQEPSTALVCSGAAAMQNQGDSFAYPDADDDLFQSLDPNGHADTPATTDTCGDLDAVTGPVDWTTNVSVRCNVSSGNLVIPSCRVWEQNANHKVSCTTLQQAGTGSKCDCTPLTVTPTINPCATKVCNDNDICTLDSCQVQNGVGVCVFTPGNAGTECRPGSGVCDVPDVCDGTHAGCTDLKKPSTTICRASAGQCDVAESCTGSTNDCPADGFAPSTTTCNGTSTGGACDGTDSCDGNGVCNDGFKSSTTSCRASAGQCDVAESCTGTSGACPADGFAPSTTTCTGTSNGGACDGTDSCDGNGACKDGYLTATTICRASAGQCDVAESCSGTSGACPDDGFQPETTTCTGTSNGGACDGTDSCDGHGACKDGYLTATTICRASAGQCDVAESCTGTSGACPADGFASETTSCVGTSNGGACDGTDSCDGAGACKDGYLTATTICRASAGQCDVAESCTGTSGACPADGFQPKTTTCTGIANTGPCDGTDSCDGNGHCEEGFQVGTICRSSAGQCDVAESCTGTESNCPVDAFQPVTTTCSGSSNGGACDGTDSCDGSGHCQDGYQPPTTVCRASAGQCDVAESCTGSTGSCPADGFAPSTTSCTGTSNGGACDGTDSCDGAGHCSDGYKPSTTICRASAGQCDVAESCTGSTGSCPADGFAPSTTSCTGTSNGGACDGTDSCDGAGHCSDGYKPATTICRAAAGECDAAESCTGTAGACPADGSLPNGTTCSSDGTSCTDDVCSAGACVHVPNGTCNAQITPTQVTCQQFAAGTAPDEPPGGYTVKGLTVNSVAPGVIFYYSHATVGAGGVITVNQSNSGSCGTGWKPMPPQNIQQVNLYTPACGNVTSGATFNSTTGQIVITAPGVAAGTQVIIGIKFTPSDLKGQAVTRVCHPTETYTFTDSSGGSDQFVIVPKN